MLQTSDRRSAARPRRLAVAFSALAAGLAVALLWASLGLAEKRVDTLVPVDGVTGETGGRFSVPRDVTVNVGGAGPAAAGDFYVVDDLNHRVQWFDADGAFKAAWGADVALPAGGTDFEVCTDEANCKAGAPSGGNGAVAGNGSLDNPQGIAVDEDTGLVYVTDRDNRRVNVYTGDGQFEYSFGWDVQDPDGTAAFEICGDDSGDICRSGDASPGSPSRSAPAGQLGPGSGFLSLAVSPPDGDPASGSLVVADPGNRRVMEFEVDAASVVADTDLFVRAWGWDVDPAGSAAFEICTVATGCQNASPPSGFPNNGQFGNGYPRHVALDSRGLAYATDVAGIIGAQSRIHRFDTTAPAADDLLRPQLLLGGTSAGDAPVALEAAPDSDGPGGPDFDRLYIAFGADFAPSTAEIEEYDATAAPPTRPGSVLDRHLAGSGVVANGIGVNPTVGPCDADPPDAAVCTGTLYVTSTSHSANRVYIADDDGAPPPQSTIDPVTAIGVREATLSGAVHHDGYPDSTHRVEYCTAAPAPSGDCSGAWEAATADEPLPASPGDVLVSVDVDGLESNTRYLARICVDRGFGAGDGCSDAVDFTTLPGAPDVVTLPPDHRGATAVTLAGIVNPNGNQTEYFFEYGTTAGDHGSWASIPATRDADAGDRGNDVRVAIRLTGLAPSTTYHYRLVAENIEGDSTGGDIAFTTRATAGGPSAARQYELVSPADKPANVGVGAWYRGDVLGSAVGFAAPGGDRYAVEGALGSTLVDGEFAYANDWAFAERGDDTVGWRSHSPVTRSNARYPGTRAASIQAISPDLSLALWGSNGSHLALFDEVAAFPYSYAVPTLGDWEGRFEVLAPTAVAQGSPGDGGTNLDGIAVADDASKAVLSTTAVNNTTHSWLGGLTGSGDPFLDRHPETRASYVKEVAGGLSDTFPGGGPHVGLGVCDPGTVIPLVDDQGTGATGDDVIGSRACPPPAPSRNAALVDDRGVSIAGGSTSGVAWNVTKENVISADGSRIFFMSPDPGALGGAAPPGFTSCAGSGDATACPPQLYVRDEAPDGGIRTRWISRSAVPGQHPALMGPALFEGASADGDKVFFRTSSPLTHDDPNGGCGAPCLTGSASPQSWDLYMYDFPDDRTADPAGGTLTRISRGPQEDADSNVQPGGSGGAARFVAEDGLRVYFTSAAQLPGVPSATSGTSTSPGGTAATSDATNLYVYDARRADGDQYRFIARLPRDTGGFSSCATTAVREGEPINRTGGGTGFEVGVMNCVRGTRDGEFITFFTTGRLLAGDPDETSGDIYAYDATADGLERITAPSDGSASSYTCAPPSQQCFGDGGFGPSGALPRARLGVASDPATPGDRIAFFQSKSRLVPADSDDEYDVYEWRNGELSLLSVGTDQAAYYASNSADGRDAFVYTKDRLTWQDIDAVLDVYDARVGGGIDPPPPPPVCPLLADGCQGPGAAPAPRPPNRTVQPGGGEADPGARPRLRARGPGRRALGRAARRGVIPVALRANVSGRVRLLARARLRTRKGPRIRVVGRRGARVAAGERTVVRFRLHKRARRQLRRTGRLRVAIQARMPEAHQRRVLVSLRRAGR